MKCPDCVGELSAIEAAGVELDVCVRCDGAWFDRGELDAFVARSQTAGMPQSGGRVFKPHADGEPARCPSCESESLRMGTVESKRGGRCAGCRGVWISGRGQPEPSRPDFRWGGKTGWCVEVMVFVLDTAMSFWRR